MDNLIKLPKTTFKKLHRNGALLLIDAGPVGLKMAVGRANDAISKGVMPEGRQTTPGSFGFIDDAGHSAWIDEANSLVYMANTYFYGGREAYNTIIYRIEQ